MQSTLPSGLTAVLVAVGAAAPPAQSLRAVVARAEHLGIRTGVAVVAVDDGRTVAGFRAGEATLPASNQKLLTVAAFLDALGTDYRFHTGFRVHDGVLEIRAGGDPDWITGESTDPAGLFAGVAARLRGAGVTALRDVRLVAGPFDGPIRPDGWPQDQLWTYYCAPTGGLVLDQGLWVVEIADGGDHDALVRLLAPPGAFTLTGRIQLTKDAKQGGRYGIVPDGTELQLSGWFLRGAGARRERGSVDDPAAVYRASAIHLLDAAGVPIDPDAPAADTELPDVETPLGPCLERTLAHSSNFDAEQLLRVLGAELRDDGSFRGGTTAVRGQLHRLCGTIPDDLAIADGSGLSRDDRVAPAFIARVLVAAANASWAEAYLQSLPQPGQSGTLKRRFRDSPIAGSVRAKTGTLNGVSALSGYVKCADGRLLAFSILMSWDRLGRGASPHDLQEAIVEAIAG